MIDGGSKQSIFDAQSAISRQNSKELVQPSGIEDGQSGLQDGQSGSLANQHFVSFRFILTFVLRKCLQSRWEEAIIDDKQKSHLGVRLLFKIGLTRCSFVLASEGSTVNSLRLHGR